LHSGHCVYIGSCLFKCSSNLHENHEQTHEFVSDMQSSRHRRHTIFVGDNVNYFYLCLFIFVLFFLLFILFILFCLFFAASNIILVTFSENLFDNVMLCYFFNIIVWRGLMYTGCHIVTKLHDHIITWCDKYIILMINVWIMPRRI
jgi:hypothetical protein